MIYQYKKTEQGDLLARGSADGKGTIFLGRFKRLASAAQIPIFVKIFLDTKNKRTWWLMESVAAHLQNDSENPSYFSCGQRQRGKDSIIHYKHPTFLVSSWEQGKVHHVDGTGRLLAGSNINGDNSLCLYTTISHFNIHPVESFITYISNDHLNWRGDSIHGKWETHNDQQVFTATPGYWPTYASWTNQIPSIIRDAYEASLQS